MSVPSQPTLSRTTHESGLVIIAIQGELDTVGTQQINDAFSVAVADRSQKMIVDLSGVPFMSSRALAMLLSHAQSMHRAGGKLALAAPTEYVLQVFQHSGFDTLFSISASVEEAIEALKQ